MGDIRYAELDSLTVATRRVDGVDGARGGLSIVYLNTTMISVPLHPMSESVFSVRSCPISEVTVSINNSTVGRTAVVDHLNFGANVVTYVNSSTTNRFVLHSYRGSGVSIRNVGVSPAVSASVGVNLMASSNREAFIAGHGNDL